MATNDYLLLQKLLCKDTNAAFKNYKKPSYETDQVFSCNVSSNPYLQTPEPVFRNSEKLPEIAPPENPPPENAHARNMICSALPYYDSSSSQMPARSPSTKNQPSNLVPAFTGEAAVPVFPPPGYMHQPSPGQFYPHVDTFGPGYGRDIPFTPHEQPGRTIKRRPYFKKRY